MRRPYDNSRTVADEAAVLADFGRRSRQAYRNLPHRRDVPYADGPRSTLDVFERPDAVGTVVFIHGGYWQWCDKADFAFIVLPLLEQRFRCVLLEYDLAPHSGLAEIVRQVGRALDFLRRQSWAGGPLILTGHSAGAHLAACHMAHPAVGALELPELWSQSARFARHLRRTSPHAPVSSRVLPGCNHYDILDAYYASLPRLGGR